MARKGGASGQRQGHAWRGHITGDGVALFLFLHLLLIHSAMLLFSFCGVRDQKFCLRGKQRLATLVQANRSPIAASGKIGDVGEGEFLVDGPRRLQTRRLHRTEVGIYSDQAGHPAIGSKRDQLLFTPLNASAAFKRYCDRA